VKAIVVYESLWGNTAAIARAIAEGIGPDARALSTAEAVGAQLEGADLIVGGAPLLGFSLPTEAMRDSIRTSAEKPPAPADLSAPSMRSWLAALPHGAGRSAAFETRIWWSPGSAAKKIAGELEAAGYGACAKPEKFVVTGKWGPLKDGELERAREWGAQLARSAG
jgi:hypothetical protein